MPFLQKKAERGGCHPSDHPAPRGFPVFMDGGQPRLALPLHLSSSSSDELHCPKRLMLLGQKGTEEDRIVCCPLLAHYGRKNKQPQVLKSWGEGDTKQSLPIRSAWSRLPALGFSRSFSATSWAISELLCASNSKAKQGASSCVGKHRQPSRQAFQPSGELAAKPTRRGVSAGRGPLN